MRSFNRGFAGLRLGGVTRRIADFSGKSRWFAVAALAAVLATSFVPPSAQAQEGAEQEYNIPAGSLADSLHQFSEQSGVQVFFETDMVEGWSAPALDGALDVREALSRLLAGTGLLYEYVNDNTLILKRPGSAAGQRRLGIEEIIVTGQKREERIQDVPIAISAFSMEDLKTSQIAGGPDLHLQVPNMTFTKTNFSGYSIQIRGIGTQAISVTTDPAVAVALNNTPFIRNRFFEQEFYDLERLEVLRGPQGTLYGRNATAGVVNLISAKPKFQHESMLSYDVGNYNTRRWEFMVNTPLVEDAVAFRLAGAGTKRDGYATNEITGNPIDGRDLWSTRASLRFAPVDGKFDMNLIWEHFEEDDDRIRSGKQLCKKDVVTEVGGVAVDNLSLDGVPSQGFSGYQATLSQGCIRNSLYAEDSFQTPNGRMLPYYLALGALGLPTALQSPYASAVQSQDLRVIESTLDPEYRARSDIGELQISYELTDTLTLDSETAYMTDEIYSMQDFNRFNTAPGAWREHDHFSINREGLLLEGPNGGIFCDPQLGCSDRLVVVGVSEAVSSQFSQEFRLSSQFGGPFDFSLGANFLRYDTDEKFSVFSNSFTMAAAVINSSLDSPWIPGVTTDAECIPDGFLPRDPEGVFSVTRCQYIDPNPLDSVNGLGHNYFVSNNPYKLKSYAIFGETYYKLTDNLKLTAGLRWSVDKKEAPRVPSQLLVGNTLGHPTAEVLHQSWREPTGRLVLDWKPNLGFTDETLIYGSYSHGYKAGGANPPSFVRALYTADTQLAGQLEESVTRPKTFDAEFVDAFEVGTKNTFADGAVTLNLTGFYYNYEGYQISEIVERTAFNRNFDLDVWGAEIEADWWALENLRLGFKGGYQRTRIDDGEQAVDLMDRTAGGSHFFVTDIENPNFDPDADPVPVSEYETGVPLNQLDPGQQFFAFENWEVVRPFPTQASSCIVPSYVFGVNVDKLNKVGGVSGGGGGPCEIAYLDGFDPVTNLPYESFPTADDSGNNNLARYNNNSFGDNYPGFNPELAPNNGEGFFKDLGGNELPNAPNYTTTFTVDYIVPLRGDWIATAHTDIYWQSKSWWRVFNDHEYARLDPYFTMNVAAIFSNEVSGWDIMAYVKNITDEDAITGAFLFSDDVGLTTNAFLVEPRLYGLRVTKNWDGGGPSQWLGRAGSALLGKEPGEPSPWALTVGGQLLRPKDSPNEILKPTFITAFDPDIDPTGEQAEDLDWGDGREIALTYAPDNGWRFSLGARFGESNRDKRKVFEGQEFVSCLGPIGYCTPGDPAYTENGGAIRSLANYGVSNLTESEEHLLIDFMVGRDVGLGAVNTTLSAGLRYAQFKSRSSGSLYGTPDWDVPPDCLAGEFSSECDKYHHPVQHTEYRATADVEREFEGAGPVVAWEMSTRLAGDESAGHLDLDWSISGGVLFGKQKTSVEGSEEEAYFDQTYYELIAKTTTDGTGPESETVTPFRYERDDESIEVVPTLGADVGLIYRIGGASIGAGYSWERYYSAIDGGVEERKMYDRTIDGPYLKVTFGGGS